jgi:hypothetical protein
VAVVSWRAGVSRSFALLALALISMGTRRQVGNLFPVMAFMDLSCYI